jgi:hypothetical protein
MNFTYIDQLGLDLSIDLAVLRRDSQRYSILLYQHEGEFFADAARIGNLHEQSVRFDAFLEKAQQASADLVMTPEYSCPWQSIKNIVNDSSKWPAVGKLWALGCESITPEELLAFNQEYAGAKVIIHHEQEEADGKHFFDPLVYLLRVDQAGGEKLFVLIQFKTHHMGAWGEGVIERNNLIEGKGIYILKNSTGSTINLFSLICSEAINFPRNLTAEKQDAIHWADFPFLILNPQINPKPTHDNFIAFRKFVFQVRDKELITLNWHVSSLYGANVMIENDCTRSGIYIDSSELDLSQDRILTNHKKGLYYFNKKKDRHAYLCSSAIHCFLINNTPVKIANVQPAQSRRDGPEVIQSFYFNNQHGLEEVESVLDEHINFLNSVGCVNQYLLDAGKCVLDKERLMCLSTGVVDANAEGQWHRVANLDSIIMDEVTEINRRLTVARNSGQASTDVRTKFVETANEFSTIFNNGNNYLPNSLSDLQKEIIMLGYSDDASQDKFRLNVIDEQGRKRIATVAYLGYQTDAKIEEVFTRLRKLFDKTTKERERVVVFYKRHNAIHFRYDTNAGSLTQTNDYDDTSIFK